MRMKHNLYLVLAGVLVLCLAACGTAAPVQESASVPAQAAEAVSEAAAEAADAVNDAAEDK